MCLKLFEFPTIVFMPFTTRFLIRLSWNSRLKQSNILGFQIVIFL
ncbi:hypothetical protein CES85_4917 [Ochrobactrum quorumnocens]|uniref:Uncharacterized protein n=1 Tax=Ochrobactrum quorumnocens TaxID=271865 RepID=A0A248UBL9_9HYPH|nr:hypothetical protein CES85_4917 [[Ochrobactrum] quorumnocens]